MTPLTASLSTSMTLPTMPLLATPRWPTVEGLVVSTISSPPPVTTGKIPAGKVPERRRPLLRCLSMVALRRAGSDSRICSYKLKTQTGPGGR